MSLVVYEKPAHFQCTHKYPLSIPGIHIGFPGFPLDSRDFHRIPWISIGFPGFPSDSLDFHWISGIPIGFQRIGNPGNPPFPPWSLSYRIVSNSRSDNRKKSIVVSYLNKSPNTMDVKSTGTAEKFSFFLILLRKRKEKGKKKK